MTPNPATGLVEVLDLAPTENAKRGEPPGAPVTVKMWPVDAKETFTKAIKLPSGAPRYVLAESYVAPDPA